MFVGSDTFEFQSHDSSIYRVNGETTMFSDNLRSEIRSLLQSWDTKPTHVEKVALAFAVLHLQRTREGLPPTVFLVRQAFPRMSEEVHEFFVAVTKTPLTDISVRVRHHEFSDGSCSCRNLYLPRFDVKNDT